MLASRKLYLLLAIPIFLWVAFLQINYYNQCPSVNRTEAKNGSNPIARLAITCCQERSAETLVLIKSAFLFSQDADLEIFLIADATCGPIVAEGVEHLLFESRRWKSNFDVKYIPYQVPPGTEHWKVPKNWMCSTSRLFLHKILPEMDAVLYLDTDHLFLSNVTAIWEYFEKVQRENPFAVVTLANHVPPPSKYAYYFGDIPFTGNGGINSGTIFMNLTRMRAFNFDSIVYETYEKYDGDFMGGPDQDILNIVFGTHKDNATIMDCSYAFHPEHCGGENGENYSCKYYSAEDGPLCFCWSVISNGVKLMHAYGHTFHVGGFWKSTWDAFEKVKLDSFAVLQEIRMLKDDFKMLPKQPQCFSLTPEVLYRNAEQYLHKIIIKDYE